jgi:hypothetical protein
MAGVSLGVTRLSRKMSMYQSSHVRYERRGNRVTPVRVTKQWVTFGQEPKVQKKFITVRASVLRAFPPADYSDCPREEPWTSGDFGPGVESRERVLGLLVKGDPEGEPVLREAGYDQCWLPSGDLSKLTAAQAAQTLDGQQGGRE